MIRTFQFAKSNITQEFQTVFMPRYLLLFLCYVTSFILMFPIARPQATGHWLLALPQATGHWPLAACHCQRPQAVCCLTLTHAVAQSAVADYICFWPARVPGGWHWAREPGRTRNKKKKKSWPAQPARNTEFPVFGSPKYGVPNLRRPRRSEPTEKLRSPWKYLN